MTVAIFMFGLSCFGIAGLMAYFTTTGLLHPVIGFICIPIVMVCGVINLIIALR